MYNSKSSSTLVVVVVVAVVEWIRLQQAQPRSVLTHASTDLEQIDPCGLREPSAPALAGT